MKRKIIKIDEEKCTGCGDCVPNCPEGALQIINGKARLVGELLCDGLGACIGNCPEGAILIEEREAEEYDELKVIQNVIQGGGDVIHAHLKHLRDHGQKEYLNQALQFLKDKNLPIPFEEPTKSPLSSGCPGMMMKDFSQEKEAPSERTVPLNVKSELRQWPIQLHLLNPSAPYFKDADLLVAADCVPFSFADFHEYFLKGKILIIMCPKLDNAQEIYLEKLSAIIQNNNVKSITLVHMEVPCCFGTNSLVQQAVAQTDKAVDIKEYTISLKGEII